LIVASGHAEQSSSERPLLERVLPPGPSASAPAIVESLGLWERPAEDRPRPHLILNMVCTLDGRATLRGHSGPISGRGDRALFHALRIPVDAVLVGAGTVRSERYGRMIRPPEDRGERVARGLAQEPLACIVSGRLVLPEDIGLLQEPSARVLVMTASPASLPGAAAQVEYLREPGGGNIDLARALGELRERYSVRSVLCEGGPHLARELFALDLVDELFLTLSPLLAGGEAAGGEALRILAGAELEPARSMKLAGILRSESYLFLRYEVVSAVRV
jgi:riboflavin-specific deaminase-like protein